MIRCQTCGTENADNSQYCDECGAAFHSAAAGDLKTSAPNFQPQHSESPVFRGANVTSIGIPPLAEEIKSNGDSLGGDVFPAKKGLHATLVIERGDAIGTEFKLSAEESNIGRWDADNGVFPDVDLDAFDPEAKVSRRHAKIVYEGDKYRIEDLGSTNGTFVNRGRRLIPGNSHALNDGDEIIVGKTFLRFSINA